ncbi:hypothetical protein QMK22_02410, partial [Cryobacterium sp. PH29-G1]|nr:hypothetical protein [Cryobacterium sp. PH29-G1]
MSQSGDTPQQQGSVDPFFAAYGTWPVSPEERAEFDAFWAQCQADWRFEVAEGLGQFAPYDALEDVDTDPCSAEPVSPDPFLADTVVTDAVGRALYRREMPDGPPLPAGLDLTEVFAAVPPEHLFDDDLREEFLYSEYLRTEHLRTEHDSDNEPGQPLPTDSSSPGSSPTGSSSPGSSAADGLSPFQRHQAQFVDRALYFEKIIAWAQASKAEVLAEAWDYTTNTAETGRPQAGPKHEHDWDATFAAQQGLVAEMACALRIPSGTASGLLHESRVLVESRPQTLDALRTGDISLRHARRLLDQLDSVPQP